MPKRTNDFQKLVYLVQVNLAAGATVTESKMLVDRVSRKQREVDVCIEGFVANQPVVVCIECRDRARPADIGWVDEMKEKHNRLETNLLILASRNGFTPQAKIVADNYGIKVISLDEVDQTDFPALLDNKSSLWTKQVKLRPRRVVVWVAATATLPEEAIRVLPDQGLYDADGREAGPMVELVWSFLNSPEIGKYFVSNVEKEHAWFQAGTREPPRDDLGRPLCLKKLEPELLRPIVAFEIQGPCEFTISEFALRRGRLGDIYLAWGDTEIGGQKRTFVATREPGGSEKISTGTKSNPSPIRESIWGKTRNESD